MPWVEVFVAFIVSHLVGDFLVQTNWQATHKHGGLTDARARRALGAHITTYTLTFIPALVIVSDSVGEALLVAAALAVPHAIQDDGRLIDGYLTSVKKTDPNLPAYLSLCVDQTFHVVALLGLALVAGS